MLNRGAFTTVKRVMPSFYEGFNADWYCGIDWVGASRGQVDELKETQAAIMRIASGLSTYEIECSRLGHDFRDIYSQWSREKRMRESEGLTFELSSSKFTTKTNPDSDDGTLDDDKKTSNGATNDGFDD